MFHQGLFGRVIRKDNGAHVVSFPGKGIVSYVCFERQEALGKGPVTAVDTSALVMTGIDGEKLLLSVSQPDLALYRGESDERIDADGRRKERSVYSRDWFNRESGEIPVTVTLKGRWRLDETVPGLSVRTEGARTVVTVVCKDGKTYDATLIRF